MSVEVKAQNDTALASVKAIYDAADQANTLLGQMEDAAEAADTTLLGIYSDAAEAASAATEASSMASSAQYNLSEIEKVVDVVNWISQHGTYVLTEDTAPVSGKYYFEYQGGAYINVTPAESDDPHDLGLYELDSIDASISNYVASHISLDAHGLVIQTDGVNSKVRISADGVTLINQQGTPIATFSSSVQLGDASGVHVTLSPTYGLEFWNGTETADKANRVAYIDSKTMKITQAEITTSLRIGKFVWKTQGTDRISLVYVP